MKQIREIINNCGVRDARGPVDKACTLITADSSAVVPGALFVAIKGTRADGHDFIPAAISKGAAAVVVEHLPSETEENIGYILVENSARALGQIAADFYDRPSSKLRLIGVTGTNGKTTIATLLFKLYRGLGAHAGLFSTVCNRIDEEVLPSTHTTPDPVKLNALMAQMVEQGCTHCFMEVSSHAVVQHRISGLDFKGGIFTNLTRDHLDYHKTFEEYIKAKKGFFDQLGPEAFALVNVDDRNGKVMVQNTRAKVYSYTTMSMGDFRGSVLENQLSGLQMSINGTEAWFRLVGAFNAYNLLAIYGAACIDGVDPMEVLTVLSGLEAVEGRFELVQGDEGITAVVDYAHTPDALQNVLKTLREVGSGSGRIITVVGAGGDRDPGKRPMMASIACELSDQVILTSDNPRSEDPEAIISEMKSGIGISSMRKVLCITDRREAIRTACALAQKGDVVLVAGKGHEKYQEIKGVKHPFDDKEILREILVSGRS